VNQDLFTYRLFEFKCDGLGQCKKGFCFLHAEKKENKGKQGNGLNDLYASLLQVVQVTGLIDLLKVYECRPLYSNFKISLEILLLKLIQIKMIIFAEG